MTDTHLVDLEPTTVHIEISDDKKDEVQPPGEPRPVLTDIFGNKDFDGRQVMISIKYTNASGFDHERFFSGNVSSGYVELVRGIDSRYDTNTVWLAHRDPQTSQYTFQLNESVYMTADENDFSVTVTESVQSSPLGANWNLSTVDAKRCQYMFTSAAAQLGILTTGSPPDTATLSLVGTDTLTVGFAFVSGTEYAGKMCAVFPTLENPVVGIFQANTKYVTLNPYQVQSWCSEYKDNVLDNIAYSSGLFNSNAAAVSFAAYVAREKLYGKTRDKFNPPVSGASSVGVIWGTTSASKTPLALNFFIAPDTSIFLLDPHKNKFIAWNSNILIDPTQAFV